MIYSLGFGAGWGLLAYGLGAKALGDSAWAGVLLGPLIGVAVGSMTQRLFERVQGNRRGLVALGSIYLGAILFGTAVGFHDFVTRGDAHMAQPARIVEAIISVLWATTMTGFVLLLWPLAYLSHWILERQLDH
ncbi:MAG: hypothetical protein ABI742_10085 [Gemmatimonadota bacterium]